MNPPIEPAKFRKYFTEYIIFALIAAIVYLYFSLARMNRFLREDQLLDKIRMEKVIDRNTNVMENISGMPNKKVIPIEQ
jgi:hypothetical protein